jgi:hypothetical protein
MCQGGAPGYVLDMTPGSNGQRAQSDEELGAQVAELASEISEAKTVSRRRKLAQQLPELAARSRDRSLRGLQTGSQVVRKRLQASGEVAARSAQAGTAAARKRAQSGTDIARKRAQSGTDVARRGAQAGARRGAQAGGRVARLGASAGGTAWQGLSLTGQWLAGQVLQMAPKVPIRNAATLREQHPGLDSDELASALIEGAARASAGVGAAVGAAAAVPFLPSAPVEVGVEILALVAIELKLVAELHEAYGMPAPGSGAERMMSYVTAWAERRGVRVTAAGLDMAIGTPVRHRLERRLIAKAGRSTLALAPLLTGAVAGAWLDHHETRHLGRRVRDDLRRRAAIQPATEV